MQTYPYRTAIAVLVVLPLLAGCFYSREIAKTKRAIERENPELHLDHEVMVSLGPLSLGFFRWVAGFVDEDEVQMARDYLKEIQRVKVGVYKVDHYGRGDFHLPRHLRDSFYRDGWDLAVKVQDHDNLVWVFYRPDKDTVRDLYVIVLEDDELVLARVRGRLNRLVAKAVSDHGIFRDLAREHQ
jgi:hypothetical protein